MKEIFIVDSLSAGKRVDVFLLKRRLFSARQRLSILFEKFWLFLAIFSQKSLVFSVFFFIFAKLN